MEKSVEKHNWKPAIYAVFYGILREIAINHGYALALHGSLTRDMDLIAIPWTEKHSTHEELINAFCNKLGWNGKEETIKTKEYKPHNRIAYIIHTGNGYIDLSIIGGIESKDKP